MSSDINKKINFIWNIGIFIVVKNNLVVIIDLE